MVSGPGPRVARLFLRVLALSSLAAWLSIGDQPQRERIIAAGYEIAPILEQARHEVSWVHFPTLFWLWASDRAIVGAVALGAASALYGTLRPGRASLFVSLPLYLSVSVAAQDFCSFQWDILLVEASFLSLFLDAERPSRAALWLLRLLCCKLYFESGLAKLLSPVGDWLSGTAMAAYFETAPLPMPLARYLHALPLGALHVMSWATLVVELGAPLLALGSRRARLVAFFALTAFQLLNLATANYGFFVPLSLALHLFLLDDDMLPRFVATPSGGAPPRWSSVLATIALVVWSALSVVDGVVVLASRESGALLAIYRAHEAFRFVGTYHLFASVTTSRVEPTIEVERGGAWTELVLHDKPGPVDRGMPIVQPHQPRVDFQLWFHGLHPQRLPSYLVRLEALLCDEPSRVQPLFVTPLASSIDAVRVQYYRYRFTNPGARDVWTRDLVWTRPEHRCGETEETGRR